MPFGEIIQCLQCLKNESFMWHQTEKGVQCSDCFESEQVATKTEEDQKSPVTVEKSKSVKKRTNTTRSYKTRQNPNAVQKQCAPKGKGRRGLFKKNPPVRLQAECATYTTRNSVLYKDQCYQVGDIVSVRDVSGGIYYAQIQGLLVDQYLEISASLTWLLPTRNDSPFAKKGFDPMTFILGPDDDLPRKIDCMEFVMHAPSDYYRHNTPFPTGLPDPFERGYIWGRLNPRQH